MQRARPYRTRIPVAGADGGSSAPPPANANPDGSASIDELRRLVSEMSVVVFARRGCCMCHVVRLLLIGHGVDPSILDVDEADVAGVKAKLARIAGKSPKPEFPAVFVGGELVGGLESVMAAHISGDLVPRLKKAKALWL